MRAKGKKNVEPMSIDFSDNIRGHLISGPNAGGKTVALKSIGLNILMALSGIFPLGICKTNFRRIFSSIGDHQSIENDLSTFSSQIIELKDILSYTEKSSLVLIDEIGSGTDPQEGAALAAGILDTLLELHSFFVATTHQSSLKTYALTKEEIQNASLEFDSKALKPTYKFLSGIPGNSYAFVLAKNFGVPDLILDRARKYIGTNQSQLEESISLLQKYKSEAEEFKIQAEQEKIKAEKYRIEYEEKLKEIKLKKKDFIGNAQEHATKILRDANAIVEKTIREIREEKRPIIEIKKDFSNFKSQLESEIAEGKQKDYNKNTDRDFEAGDTIIAGDSNNSGTIITVDKQHQTAVVEFNGLKFKMSFDKMIKTKKKEKLRGSKADYLKFETQSTLDLRGMRAGEALAEVDNFISSSILSSVQSVTIIHGKGTGALRQAVHDFLASHPSSLKFRLGNLVEGGDGVTIVDF
ncbi:MAG: Smr/MutS family protein [Bacteroidota bacterium]